jgi:hypothetical protein
MPTIGIRKVAALLLAVALLAAAAPAAAAPERPGEEARGVPEVFEAFWLRLSALWPGTGSDLVPEQVREALGSCADPDGAPQGTSGDPTAEPQLGSDLDPNG